MENKYLEEYRKNGIFILETQEKLNMPTSYQK